MATYVGTISVWIEADSLPEAFDGLLEATRAVHNYTDHEAATDSDRIHLDV